MRLNIDRKNNNPFTIENTYCNPLPIPDYPRGRLCWESEDLRREWRELADPSVLYYDNKWYLYPSSELAYITRDFVHWEHHRVEPNDIGYAPTALYHDKQFYLLACGSHLYRSDSPLGPFKDIGSLLDTNGKEIQTLDPMLFADDDNSVYLYWGCSICGGIYGAQLDPKDLRQLVTDRKTLFKYNPDHRWERFGDFNEDKNTSFIEGPWMFKHNNTYYLTYAAGGTTWKTYAMGCYKSEKPLGPFIYQKRNPILRNATGLVNGTAHGCIVGGPGNTIWAFYTCSARITHGFERRIGMDPAGIDENGDLYVKEATETPQWAPGIVVDPEKTNSTGLLPVTVNKVYHVSTEKDGRSGQYAIDNNLRTFWEPELDDENPWIEVELTNRPRRHYFFEVSAGRICWIEPNLNHKKGNIARPIKYKIEVCQNLEKNHWRVVVDKTDNNKDMFIDYQTFSPIRAQKVRLIVTARSTHINVGISDFTVFGKAI